MSTVYFLFGLAQAVTGYAAYVFERQEAFQVRREEYPNIGTNPRRLVVFFSRMGYVEKIAYEEANRTGAAVYEIRAAERTEGTLGFWWCGRYGMHRWKMPIVPIDVDLTQYEHVTVCSPIWVFGLAAPVRSFCEPAAGRFGRRIIFWCTTRRIHTGMPPRRWIGFWGFSIVDFEVYSAEKGK